MFEFDLELCGPGEIAGADEAGRGCLAGPLVAAAVVFDYSSHKPAWYARILANLADSKQLSAGRREELFPLITRHAARYAIIVSGNRTIDAEGLHVTNLKSLCQSVESLAPWPDIVVVDGRQQLPQCTVPHVPVTGGDKKSACIAAASIIAKVARDRLMRSLHSFYPVYGFDRHVGYGTKEHRAAIARHGFCDLHRRSFKMGGQPGEMESG